MKYIALFLSAAALTAVANAQTAATPAAKSVTTTTKTATKTTTAAVASPDWWLKLPAGIPRVHGIVKPDFTLRYEDIKIGTGAEAVPNKMYHVNYTGYLAATGEKFDSNSDRRLPKKDKDGKPVMGADGKPVLDEPQPLVFPQGYGRLIPGFDQGFTGMKVGGKRRLFIPWQLAYGTRDIPGHPPEHPGIPPKSNLIFDIELVDISDMPAPPQRPPMQMRPQGKPGAPGAPGAAPGVPPKPGTPPAPGAAAGSATAPGAAPATAPASSSAPAKAPTTAPGSSTAPATTQPAANPSQPAQPQH